MIHRYRFISEHRATMSVQRICHLLGIRRAGFYQWCAAEDTRAARADSDRQLLARIHAIHTAHKGTYGAPRITAELHRQGHQVNHKRVERLMREHHIVGLTRRKRRATTITDPAATPAKDLIRRTFTATAPGQRFVGDITALPTYTGWTYLATVIDLYSREIVGHALAEHMRADLICEAITLAAGRGRITPGAVFHSDRGSQYTSVQFRQALTSQQIRPSMGRTGSCYDNALAESFFATLKAEIGTPIWEDHQHARREITRYLAYYNHNRLHSTIGYSTPHEARISYSQQLAA